jgi:hypothetical protein
VAFDDFRSPGRWGRTSNDRNPRPDVRGEGFDPRGSWRRGSDYYGPYGSGRRWYPPQDAFVRSGIREPLTSYARENPSSSPWQDADDRGSQQAEYRGGRAGLPRVATNEESISHRGRGPKGHRRSDERIRELVCEVLTDESRVDASDIEVCVADGVVTLSGFVDARQQKRLAEDVISDLNGVTDVLNELRIAKDSTGRRGR